MLQLFLKSLWKVLEPLFASSIAFELECSHCLRRPRARQCIAIAMRDPTTRFTNINRNKFKYIIELVDSVSRDERDVPLTQYITNA